MSVRPFRSPTRFRLATVASPPTGHCGAHHPSPARQHPYARAVAQLLFPSTRPPPLWSSSAVRPFDAPPALVGVEAAVGILGRRGERAPTGGAWGNAR